MTVDERPTTQVVFAHKNKTFAQPRDAKSVSIAARNHSLGGRAATITFECAQFVAAAGQPTTAALRVSRSFGGALFEMPLPALAGTMYRVESGTDRLRVEVVARAGKGATGSVRLLNVKYKLRMADKDPKRPAPSTTRVLSGGFPRF